MISNSSFFYAFFINHIVNYVIYKKLTVKILNQKNRSGNRFIALNDLFLIVAKKQVVKLWQKITYIKNRHSDCKLYIKTNDNVII